MIKAKIYVETEHEIETRDFYFDINDVNGCYIYNEETMFVLINGYDYSIVFDVAIFKQCIEQINKRKLFNYN